MKIPVIKQLYKNTEESKILATLEVLEAFTESRGISELELDVVGELMTNLCGALEVHNLVKDGMKETDALNGFAQKVMCSIDRG